MVWRITSPYAPNPGLQGTATGYGQHLDLRRMLLQFGQRLLHRLIVDMAGQVDEEAVLPLGVVRGPRLDPVHADAVTRERAEYVEQHTGLVVDEDQHRGAVVARWREDAAADHQEARGVVLVVLDRAHDDLLQAIHMGGARRRWRRR